MALIPKYQLKFDEQKVCIIIPTYNNSKTLGSVINDVLEYSHNVIIVNDGSTDGTQEILRTFSTLEIISIKKNKGKGNALQIGFKRALELGYKYAVTIDSDGQHFAKDLPVFLNRLEHSPSAIIIGARNMEQESVPGKSSFGHKISNFSFIIETGIDAPDTQSGYRLYPIFLMKDFHFYTKKFEFEIEVLVRSAWKGINIDFVPVSVYYAGKERVTHFRPFTDFTRISIMHTMLIIISVIYIKPRDFFRKLFYRKNYKEVFKEHLFNKHESDLTKSLSIAFGVFMGIIPIWGFQLIAAITLAILLKLNKPLVIIAANISIPPMIPLIIFLSYKMGAYSMGANAVNFEFTRDITLESIKQNSIQYIYGSITLAITAGIISGLLCYIILKLFHRKIETDTLH